MERILYVYAVGDSFDRQALAVDPVEDDAGFGVATGGGVSALFSPVDPARFSQEEIDRHAKDLQWLGAIGYRHQSVVSAVAKQTTIIPLRAFTLFTSVETLEEFLRNEGASLR